jgi:alpha-galactosidase/6-phospho-beta-glucosidase family protein
MRAHRTVKRCDGVIGDAETVAQKILGVNEVHEDFSGINFHMVSRRSRT